MNILPPTMKRVEMNTCPCLNRKIKVKTTQREKDYKNLNKEELSEIITKLENEWDVERVVEAHAATWFLVGTILGCYKNKKWLLLSGFVGCSLLKHALQGWCPSLPIIRMLGVRTANEINEEINMIKKINPSLSR